MVETETKRTLHDYAHYFFSQGKPSEAVELRTQSPTSEFFPGAAIFSFSTFETRVPLAHLIFLSQVYAQRYDTVHIITSSFRETEIQRSLSQFPFIPDTSCAHISLWDNSRRVHLVSMHEEQLQEIIFQARNSADRTEVISQSSSVLLFDGNALTLTLLDMLAPLVHRLAIVSHCEMSEIIEAYQYVKGYHHAMVQHCCDYFIQGGNAGQFRLVADTVIEMGKRFLHSTIRGYEIVPRTLLDADTLESIFRTEGMHRYAIETEPMPSEIAASFCALREEFEKFYTSPSHH